MYAINTIVPVSKTRSEIDNLLERHKARQYGSAVDYELMKARVQFRLHDRVVRFVINLPDRKKFGDGVRFERAERQRWRALLLVLKAKLEAVENNIETFDQSFLAQIVMPNDQTVADFIVPSVVESYRQGKFIMARASLPAHTEGKATP